MPKRIIFPLNVPAYLADTEHLSTQEHGAYLLLLFSYWMNGKLPENSEALRRIAKIPRGGQWGRMRPRLQAFFHHGWLHKRVDLELAKRSRLSKIKTLAADVRWLTEKNSEDNSELCRVQRSGSNPLKLQRATHAYASQVVKQLIIPSDLVGPTDVDKSQRLRQDAELHSQTKTNKHQLARSAWQHDLAEKFGADFFAEALDVFGRYPKFVERATAAELRSPGTGCVSAMISLKRVLGGSE